MSRENLNQVRQDSQQIPSNQLDQLVLPNAHLINTDQALISTSPSSASSTNRISIQQNSTDELATKNVLDEEPLDENDDDDIDDEDDDEDEDDVDCVEDSPDGRWSKRNQHVSQRDVPGIDKAFLAMDTENGFEVVWNEIYLTGGKRFKTEYVQPSDQKKINEIFQNLINLNHPNIVKFHHYWIDETKKRIVFITEYMPSGSLKQFLRKAKKTNQSIKKQTWKRWCIQLLSALHYLHNLEPAIIHDDLSCDTIYIQHNGLIKIGCIAPDIVNKHVKTCVDFGKFARNAHYIAPEFRSNDTTDLPLNIMQSSITSSLAENGSNGNHSTNYLNKKTTAVDIYAFGMVALEMFNLEFGGNGDTHPVTTDLIKQSIEALDTNQQDFILKCLEINPNKRPTAKDLLFHPLLFEVPSLRLLAAHQLIRNQNESKG
jgi:nuclear receptor-binding protein